MALVVKDRVKETTSTTGTGTVTLAGASDGFQAFTVIGNANTTYYTLVSGSNFEVGLGTYTLSGTTLSRDTVLESSNSGSKISLSGTSDVFCTYPAEKAVALNGTVINDANVVSTSNIVNDAVTENKLNLISTGSVPSLEAKGTSGVTDGYIQLNCAENSHGIKLKSPPHSAGASYTLTFPNNDGDADQFLQTNGSGVMSWAAPSGGGIEWQSSIVTGATHTAVANEGYWINTTSNGCVITLPASATVGDQIIFKDYLRTWNTNTIQINSNGLNFQGQPDTFLVEYNLNGQVVNIVYSGASQGWTPINTSVIEAVPSPAAEGLFSNGNVSGAGTTTITNKVGTTGIVASDILQAGLHQTYKTATRFGSTGQGILLFGGGYGAYESSNVNLVSNTGLIATASSGVGTARIAAQAVPYGSSGLALMAYGYNGSAYLNTINLISAGGSLASDSSGVGTASNEKAGASYGGDKAIIGFGNYTSGKISVTNLVSNSGVISADVTGVGTARQGLAAAGYGTDKAIFAYGDTGSTTSISNLVNSSGVVSSDVTGVGTARKHLGATTFGSDKAIFAFGDGGGSLSISNLVSNSGVVATDTAGVGTPRSQLPGLGIGT